MVRMNIKAIVGAIMILFGTQLIADGIWTGVHLAQFFRYMERSNWLPSLRGWAMAVMVVAVLLVVVGVPLVMTGMKPGASPEVCTCGRPLSPGAQFCAGCGRKTDRTVSS